MKKKTIVEQTKKTCVKSKKAVVVAKARHEDSSHTYEEAENPTTPVTIEVPEESEKSAPVTVEMVAPGILEAHPKNLEIYGQSSFPEELKASIEATGITTPLLVNSQNQIISGHHRWEVAKSLELLAIPIIRKQFENSEDEVMEIIHSNLQRQITEVQKLRCYAALLEVERVKAKRRQATKRSKETLPEAEFGQARDLAAKPFGKTGKTMSEGLKALHLSESLQGSNKTQVINLLIARKYKTALEKAEELGQLEETDYPEPDEDLMRERSASDEDLQRAVIQALKDAVDALEEVDFQTMPQNRLRECRRLLAAIRQHEARLSEPPAELEIAQ